MIFSMIKLVLSNQNIIIGIMNNKNRAQKWIPRDPIKIFLDKIGEGGYFINFNNNTKNYDQELFLKIFIDSKPIINCYLPASCDRWFHMKYSDHKYIIEIIKEIPTFETIRCVLVPKTKVPFVTNTGAIHLFDISNSALQKYGVKYLDNIKINNFGGRSEPKIATIIGVFDDNLWMRVHSKIHTALSFFDDIKDYDTMISKDIQIMNYTPPSLFKLSVQTMKENLMDQTYDLSVFDACDITNGDILRKEIKDFLRNKILSENSAEEKIKSFQKMPESLQIFLFQSAEDQRYFIRVFFNIYIDINDPSPAPYLLEFISTLKL